VAVADIEPLKEIYGVRWLTCWARNNSGSGRIDSWENLPSFCFFWLWPPRLALRQAQSHRGPPPLHPGLHVPKPGIRLLKRPPDLSPAQVALVFDGCASDFEISWMPKNAGLHAIQVVDDLWHEFII